MYKTKSAGAPSSPRISSSSTSDIPANFAPTTNPEHFPLEAAPAVEPESLDNIYGSYVSPMGATETTSSHRCLDDQEHPLVVELTLSPAPSPSYLSLADLRKHELIYRFEREWNVDVVLQTDTLWRRHPRLVVFDMDSTLITQEVIDLGVRDTIPMIDPSLNHTTIGRLANTINDYEFVIHPGDLGYADDWLLKIKNLFSGTDAYAAIVEQFFGQLAPISGRKPYMVGPGNHEANCQEIPQYVSHMSGGFSILTRSSSVPPGRRTSRTT
ncbi:hypothetical protein NUW58_g10827 [Xylaria curta]|uniref:Uncharacterized protein n=1 Tax=Xylaria curta TaxID=42375 RepID=A0ACC1MGG5_9PEZI|nr:hypothetical protein NUW58_g10827 [Xylaria curta]